MTAGLSNLVVLYCVTAGRNQTDLGTDEKQIIMLVYVVIDVSTQKVTAIRKHYVRPQIDPTMPMLTDECKSVTHITEQAILSAIPLDQVILEMDEYFQKEGIIKANEKNGFAIITDGQMHLRMCVQPEATRKSIILPDYYNTFIDLRKEFQSRYTTDGCTSIEDMLQHLNLAHPNSGEFGVAHARAVGSIVTKMLAEGHKFTLKERIKDFQTGLCNDINVDDDTVVRARGLPWQTSDQDIADFFRGLNIVAAGIALCLSSQGRRNGEALVRFECQEHRDLALRRHRHHMEDRYIEIYRASGSEFAEIVAGDNQEAKQFLTRGGKSIIRMRGLPYTASADQLIDFFRKGEDAVNIMHAEDGILFVKHPNGKATGDAFVLFQTEEEGDIALSKHRQTIGTRYIELFRSTVAEVQQVLNRSYERLGGSDSTEPQPMQWIPAIPAPFFQSPTSLPPPPVGKSCIRLRNLPPDAEIQDILHFLGDEMASKIVCQGVHWVYTAEGIASGDAIIQMDCEQSASFAVQHRNKQSLVNSQASYTIEVYQCSAEDLQLIANGSMPPTPVVPAKDVSPVSEIAPQAVAPQTYQYPPFIPTSPYAATQYIQPQMTVIPQNNLPLMQPVIYYYPPQQVPAQVAQICAVMRNLPPHLTPAELSECFKGFDEVSAESIQIQPSVDGSPGNDAIVQFKTRSQAERASLHFHHKIIGNHLVEMFFAQ